MPEDLNADENAPGVVETRTRIYLEGADTGNVPLVDKVERTSLGQDGMTETTTIRLTRASGCRHVLHTGAEIGGICANPRCRRILCQKCAAESVCARCGMTVCGSCRRRVWLRGDEDELCPRCAMRWLARQVLIAAAVALAAFLLLARLAAS